MTAEKQILSLEKIAQSAEEQGTEILLDATAIEFSRHFQVVKGLYRVNHLHLLNQEDLISQRDYLNFLIEFAKLPYVKSTKRVIAENQRLPEMMNKRLNHLKHNSKGKGNEKRKKENLSLEYEIQKKINEYIANLEPSAYDSEDANHLDFFLIATILKELNKLTKKTKKYPRYHAKQKQERQKFADLKGEDSISAIALQKSTKENKSSHILSNDRYTQYIITNFYVIAKLLDEHYKGTVSKKLEKNPIRIHQIPKYTRNRGYQLELDTSKPDEMQTLDEISDLIGGDELRNTVYLLRRNFDSIFGGYPRKTAHKLMEKLKE